MKLLKGLSIVSILILTSGFSSCAQQESNPLPNSTIIPVQKTEQEWKKELSPDEYYVLREKGTESAFSGAFLLHKEKGNYTCAACGNILFKSDAKFDSHCGWPSFDKQVSEKAITTKEDNTHGMQRTEIMCGKCGGHLGHIFDDGPTETGKRYCVNSVSLGFEPAGKSPNSETTAVIPDTITLGGGCFWCMEAVFQDLKGVLSVESGFSGGKANSTYKEVCDGTTGHAEVIQVIYDTSKIRLAQLLKVFFTLHDPTTMNQQGMDIGTQYRSIILYRNSFQKNLAEKIIRSLNTEKAYERPIVTEVVKFVRYYKAESYHQDYYSMNKNQPYCQKVIQPKIDKLEKVFKELIE